MSASLPYPGLRPFRRDETDIFFGREQQTDLLLQKLDRTRFLAVVGGSGCGKSSLVRAGLISSLEGGFVLNAGPHWRVVDMRPGDHPMQRLARGLLKALDPQKRDDPIAAAFIHSTLRRGPLGLLEVLQDVPLPAQANLLLLVDQFEEIFRYHREGGTDESEAFVALLLESALQPRFPVYVVITMRSDFIGDCAIFANLPEAINESQFLTSRMTRDQRRSAIVGPARVFGGDVDSVLVNSLLNDMGSDPNQLPLMQHVLMRMWTQAGSKDSEGRLSHLQTGKVVTPWPVLTLNDYASTGRLEKALSKHADEAFSDLKSDEKERIARVLFRALCERGTDKRDERRPVALEVVSKVAGVSPGQVAEVVEVFREPTRSFITPGVAEKLHPNTRLDISHECLIKQWDRLNEWANQESQSGETFCFLAKTAREWKKGRAALWETPNLEVAEDWKRRENPTPTWAARYQKCAADFDDAMEFLDASMDQRRRKEADKEARRQHQLRHAMRVSWSLGATLLLVAVLLYWYFWANIKEKVSYYDSFVTQWGLPKGVGNELSSDQVQHRAVSFKLIRKGSRSPVTRVIAVNSTDQPTPYHTLGTHLEEETARNPFRECREEYFVGEDGQVVYVKAFDRDSNLVWGRVYAPRGADDSVVRVYYVGPSGHILSKANSAAELIEILYSREGFESRIRYFDRDGKPQRGLDKAYGRRQDFDTRGSVTRVVSLARDGITPMIDEAGNAILECEYDSLGNLVQQAAFDAAGKATYFRDGYHKCALHYDGFRNLAEIDYCDEGGARILNKDWIHRVVLHYDDHGNKDSMALLDIDGNPILCRQGYACTKYRYDSFGNVIEQVFMDTQGNRCLCKDGYAITESEYDSAGNYTRWTCYDIDSNATNCAAGYASYTAKFDRRGNRVEVAYRSVSGKLLKPPTQEASAWTSEYDNQGREIRRMFMGIGSEASWGRPVYAGWTKTYNQRGNETEMTFLDNIGERFENSSSGYAIRRREFDADANMISESYYDKADRPIKVEGLDYARLRAGYNDDGDRIWESYYDIQDTPTRCSKGFFRWERSDTTGGREVRVTYWDTERRRFANREGYTGKLDVYDERGNQIRLTYLDADDRPAVTQYGYASKAWEYNNRGDLTRGTYHDSRGRRVMSTDAYAGFQYVYDSHGNRIRLTHLDVNDKPVVTKEGYASIAWEYNNRGDLTKETYLDARNKAVMRIDGYAGWSSEYDMRGNETLRRYFGKNGQTVLRKDGYAMVRQNFDSLGNLVYRALAGVDGKPVKSTEKYAIFTAEFDKRGNEIKESYRNKDSSLCLSNFGYAEVRSEFDDAGNVLSQEYFGPDQKPRAMKDGYSMWQAEYDSQGNQVKTSYFVANRRPTMITGNFSQVQRKFNDRNLLEAMSTYDTNGKLVVNSYGFARVIRTYDTSGHLIEITSYGTDGKPREAIYGYARMSKLYDKTGNLREESYFGADGQPILLDHAYARRTWRYDDWGNIVEEAYYGTDGNLILCWVDNVVEAARWVASYSPTGQLTKKKYFDARGRSVLEK